MLLATELQFSESIALVQEVTVAIDDWDASLHALPVQHIGKSALMQSVSVKPVMLHALSACLQNSLTMILH